MADLPLEESAIRLGAALLLVLANALFVADEFGLVASRRTRIDAMIRAGDTKARVVRTLGRLPHAGERITIRDSLFEVLEMDGRRVGKVRVVAQRERR